MLKVIKIFKSSLVTDSQSTEAEGKDLLLVSLGSLQILDNFFIHGLPN